MRRASALVLYQKERPERVRVDGDSLALFRLGEQCNNACPMCSNSGRPEAFHVPLPELLRRVDHLADAGFRAVVVTGGEPTIHPGFWEVVAALRARAIAWDINTHGRAFSDPRFAARALASGLRRAIVSFHSHEVDVSRAMFGTSARGHEQTVDGIRNLLPLGRRLMLNTVLSALNADSLADHLRWCAATFGAGYAMKFCFPSFYGKGGDWDAIQIRYESVRDEVRRLPALGRELGIALEFESIPSCILGDADAENMGRGGFGETHYLEDIRGVELYSIRWIEAEMTVYPKPCLECRAFSRCPGVSGRYVERFGADALVPFR